MRRITLFIAVAMALCLSACAQNSQKKETKQMKTLVAYFSCTGTTRAVAKQLAEVTGGNLYEITPAQPYTEADLDWNNSSSRSTVEMRDAKSRPAIKGKIDNFNDYSVIYVGFPIWWYTAPTIIDTFLESYNFEGKIVIPFATSGGSDIDKADRDLAKIAPKATFKKGRLLNRANKQTLTKWVESLNL
jgi:flavodoxin